MNARDCHNYIERQLDRLMVVMATSKSARSLNTERTYVQWMRRFMYFSICQPDVKQGDPVELARRFVEAHARQWSVATQDQFRNALVFYYKHVLGREIGDLGAWAHAQRPKRLPTYLPHDDMLRLLSCMKGETKLMAEIDYGSGLRSFELAKLRWKDIDWTRKQIMVRGGKGDKDRVTFLPESCIPALMEQRDRMRRLWEYDRAHGRPGVEVPSDKYDGQEWAWFWVWGAHHESRDPRSGIVRRHHLHRSTLGKAVSVAVKLARLDQRVTVHSLRHSFATECLMDGMPIQELKELMGHASIETTQVYAHCLPRVTQRRWSPMDRQPVVANVVPFAADPAVTESRFSKMAS